MARETKTILVGTSLDQLSDPVVRAGADLARLTGAELYLLHAHSLPVAYFAAPTGLTTVSPDLLETERQVRRQMLDEQLSRLGIAPESLGGTIVEAGAPHRMLLEAAGTQEADLIVVGARETAGRTLHGSTTDRVLRKASCPVWVIGGDSSLPPKRVLAPVDLSPLSDESLRSALEILGTFEDVSELDIEALFILTPEEHESSTQFTPEQIERLAHEELDRFVDQTLTPGRLDVRRKVRIGEIRKEILAELAETPTDLLILGTHGRSGFERFLLGSVASDLAGQATCNVLIVPPHEAKDVREEEED
ncbi:MAG: universal stress protein [bacterium]|nr:universal stress protein [bacterium]